MILVCAATRTEAAACRRGIRDGGARGVDVLATGVGPVRAAEALQRWIEEARARGQPSPALVVSSGFAGAITPGLERLAWVTASAVHRLAGANVVPAAIPLTLLRVASGASRCDVLSADAVVARTIPGLQRPAVADMESAALAEVAGGAGIPFAVLRLVTDTPANPLDALGRHLAATLSAANVAQAASRGAGAVLQAARAPGASATFLRDALGWRSALRARWCAQARDGLRFLPVEA